MNLKTNKRGLHAFYLMEIEREFYSIQPNNEEVLMPKELLQYFRTLNDMVTDFQDQLAVSKEGHIILPIIEENLTARMLTIMIHFYSIYRNTGAEHVQDVLNGMNLANEEETELYREWLFIVYEESELTEMAKMADYLHANEFLTIVIDYLYKNLEERDIAYLEKRLSTILKRKIVEPTIEAPLTFLYQRALLIKEILSHLLTQDLVRGIDRRIWKYVNLVADSEKMSFIRYGKDYSSLFVRRAYTSNDLALIESVLSFSKGEHLLHTEKINVLVVGDTFYGILNKEGDISFFGELTIFKQLRHASVEKRAVQMNEQPLERTKECLAVWSGRSIFVMLTINTLILTNSSKSFTSDLFKAKDIIDVSCGYTHSLILSTKGLFGWGDNRFNQLTKANQKKYLEDIIRIPLPDENDEVEKIHANGYYSIVLTKSGKLYAIGRIEPDSLHEFTSFEDWQEIAIDERIDKTKIQLLSGGESSFIIVIANAIWMSNYENTSIDDLLEIVVEDEVRQVIETENYMLIVTSSGVYFLGDDKFLKEFGGSSSLHSPYKLHFTMGEIEASTQSNKKPRLSCLKCFAEPRFFSKKNQAAFCSRYCLYQK